MHTNHYSINIKGTLLDLTEPKVMGILNVTDDSFYDGGMHNSPDSAKRQIERMVDEGVDIIDVGGASSKPGSEVIALEHELARVMPVLELLGEKFPKVVVSIDTNRAAVAEAAIVAGADIVNDISAGDDDPDMLKTVAQHGAPFIAMHKKGTPQTMQKNPQYDNVVKEVLDYFIKKKEQCKSLGINDLVLDLGFGFGKTVEHNYSLLKHMKVFQEMLNLPILTGVSRKSMITRVLDLPPKEALNGTTTLNTLALNHGANIIRVHDVREAKQVIRLLKAYQTAP